MYKLSRPLAHKQRKILDSISYLQQRVFYFAVTHLSSYLELLTELRDPWEGIILFEVLPGSDWLVRMSVVGNVLQLIEVR